MRPCKPCHTHYGDGGPCDEGKPTASPHRPTITVNRAALRGERLTALGFNVHSLGAGVIATFATPEAARAAVTDAIRFANTPRCAR